MTTTVNSENAFVSDETFLSRIAFSSQGRVFSFNLTWFCIDWYFYNFNNIILCLKSEHEEQAREKESIITEREDDKLILKHIDLKDDQSLL